MRRTLTSLREILLDEEAGDTAGAARVLLLTSDIVSAVNCRSLIIIFIRGGTDGSCRRQSVRFVEATFTPFSRPFLLYPTPTKSLDFQ